MNWSSIRLELARTRDFPRGSPSRYYLLRLPLAAAGVIDEAAMSAAPARATVRRFWPSQADMRGLVVKTATGWGLAYEPGEEGDAPVFVFYPDAMRVGGAISLTEPDGQDASFLIASVEAISRSGS